MVEQEKRYCSKCGKEIESSNICEECYEIEREKHSKMREESDNLDK
jgi:predicted amidophosphoribosyltransferase